MTVWLTGLPGSGKSTIAQLLDRRLFEGGRLSYVLDGDNLREGLNSDLEFSPDDRNENVRRVGEVALLMADAGIVTLVPIISPYREERERVRRGHLDAGLAFFEVFVDAPLSVCVERDPKGLYALAAAGELQHLTGVDAPYEAPGNPDLRLDSSGDAPEPLADEVMRLLAIKHTLPS